MMSPSLLSVLLVIGLGSCRVNSDPGTPPAPAPPAAPEAPSAPDSKDQSTVHHPDPVIDAQLARIESQGRQIKTLSGSIIYQKEEALLGRKETRTGSFAYQARTASSPERLAVLFDQLVVNNVRRQRKREFLFDGIWLTEIDFDRKTIIRRQQAPEGSTVEPLAAGSSVFLFTGFSRSDLLRRCDVTGCDTGADAWTSAASQGPHPVFCLQFVPRAGTPEADERASTVVVFDDVTLVPVAIVETEDNGDRKLVRLSDVQVNPDLDEATRQKLLEGVPDPLPGGWKLHVEPLGTPAAGGGSG